MSTSAICNFEIPTRIFGDEVWDCIRVDLKNIVLKKTIVDDVYTRGSLRMRGANVLAAEAEGEMTANQCELSRVIARKTAFVSKSVFYHITAHEALAISDCDTQGFVTVKGPTYLIECSKFSMKSDSNAVITRCDGLLTLEIKGAAYITDSKIKELIVGGETNLFKTTIDELKISGSLKISDSEIRSLTSNYLKRNSMGGREELPGAISLHNSRVKDITFSGYEGVVYLDDKSQVTGKITGGKIHSILKLE